MTPGHDGRFAPSPTGELHLGNLRTALLAWLFARSQGARFLVRVEDLDPDRVVPGLGERQLADLAAIGLDWDGVPVWQSHRLDDHRSALRQLDGAGQVYRCYCTRAEIREAASAPHGLAPDGMYPGTCRELTATQVAEHERAGRDWCLRLRGNGQVETYVDRLLGEVSALVDDFVVQRKDGVPAYNLAVVVDDAAQGIGEVVRGADLASSTPRQRSLQTALGLSHPAYAHVPLLLGPDGRRLSKRHGGVTWEEWRVEGRSSAQLRGELAASVGLAERGEEPRLDDLLERFQPEALPTADTTWEPGGDA